MRGAPAPVLLHLSCHGLKDDEGRPHFATQDTDKDLPASTAVPAAFLHDQMARCRARTIVVLLDCCYSGAFLPGAKGDDYVQVKEELAYHGRAILTATNRTEYAWEGDHLAAAAPQPSRFTGALIEGLRSGDADADQDGRIPAGLRSGQTLRLVAHGTMHLRGGGRGDLLLQLDVGEEQDEGGGEGGDENEGAA